MRQEELNIILEKHKKWINNQEGGKTTTNLRSASFLRKCDVEKYNLDHILRMGAQATNYNSYDIKKVKISVEE